MRRWTIKPNQLDQLTGEYIALCFLARYGEIADPKRRLELALRRWN